MDVTRNTDGSPVVPVPVGRHDDGNHDTSADAETSSTREATRVLHSGEGGYSEALTEWDLQQNLNRAAVVSTADGREEAMRIVHALAASPDADVAAVLSEASDPAATGGAPRHVLVGGTHSLEAFCLEVADGAGEDGEPIATHTMTKIIGEVLAELDR